MKLKNQSNILIDNLSKGKLTYDSITNFYQEILNNFDEIKEFDDYSNYKKTALILSLMLEIKDFVTDPDERQKIASISYYIVTKGLYKFIYENDSVSLWKEVEFSDLIATRLSIINDSLDSIKYTLNVSNTISDNLSWNPYSTLPSLAEETLDEMRIYDALNLFKLKNSVSNIYIHPNAFEIGDNVINEFNYMNMLQLERKCEQGYKSHLLLYKYLENRFQVYKDFEF